MKNPTLLRNPMRHDLISRLHADLRHALLVGRGATTLPQDAVRWQYKEYPRMERVMLPESGIENASSLTEALTLRSSERKNTPLTSFSLQDASFLLQSARMRADNTRPYPSGGALYPIETYLLGSIAGSPSTVFHYHPKAHALECLWEMPAHTSVSDLFFDTEDESVSPASAAIVFTAMWERSASKYGDFAYNLALLEAGHLAQNILLLAAARSINARPMAGFKDGIVSDVLTIDANNEQAVYSIKF